jgi:hypothetical protein
VLPIESDFEACIDLATLERWNDPAFAMLSVARGPRVRAEQRSLLPQKVSRSVLGTRRPHPHRLEDRHHQDEEGRARRGATPDDDLVRGDPPRLREPPPRQGSSHDEVSAAIGHSSSVVTKRFYDHFIRRSFSPRLRLGLGKQATGAVVPMPKR